MKLLKKKYPQVDVRELLRHAGMEPYQVSDEGHWFTQRQVDAFHEKLDQLLGEDISREAGRYAASEDSIGVTGKYVFGTIGPTHTFYALGKAASNFTRSATYTTKKIADNKVEITVKPLPGVDERPYQCENRIGFFEAMVMVFSYDPPQIEHPDCLFRGGTCCRYIVSWRNTPYARVRKIRNVVLPLAFLLYAPIDHYYGIGAVEELSVVLAFFFLGASYLAERLEKKEIAKALSKLEESTEAMIEEIGINYDNARMVNEVGQAIGKQGDVDDVLENIVKVIEKRLGYDRGVIMLADATRSGLSFRTGFGYNDEELELLQSTTFNLADPDSQGVFVTCFRDRTARFVTDFSELADIEKNIFFSEALGAQSFICCAIVCEGESLGILAVDNMRSGRKLKESDLSLLTGIAPVIGMTLRNAIYIDREKRITEQVRQSQKMEAVGLLARGIAHDFNNLLTAITGFVELAQLRSREGDPTLPFLEKITAAADKAAGLTRGLLTFSRKQVTNLEKTELNTILRNVNKLVSRLITKHVEVQWELCQEPLPVFADSGQIDQVVMNLVTNARDAMAGGGVLTIKTEVMEMGEQFLQSHGFGGIGAYAVLSVADTGEGMDEATLSQVLEPFFTTKDVGKGTGLGLAIVYGIVKQHDGFLELQSGPKTGTTVKVYLPLLLPLEDVQAPASAPQGLSPTLPSHQEIQPTSPAK